MRKFQTGAATVEIAIVSLTFIWLMLAIVEVGRGMYTWNALTEATRLGSRAASVCQIQDNVISQIATFNGNDLLGGLKEDNISVNYLDANGAVVANPNPANELGFLQVRYVQVTIQNYQYDLLIPGLNKVTLPAFSTTVPRQSFGIVPNEAPGC